MSDFQSAIYNTVISQGYSDSLGKIIVAQAQDESANFTSNLFQRANNPFGMTYGGQKLAGVSDVNQPKKEGGTSYASYPNVETATLDLLGWLNRRQNEGKFNIADLNTPDAYAQALKDAGYYTDRESTYAANLRYYFGRMKEFVNAHPVAVYGVGGAVLAISLSLISYGIYAKIKNRSR